MTSALKGGRVVVEKWTTGLISCLIMYRDEIYSLQILLSRTKAGPGRTVKQEQEEISPNHVQRLNLITVYSDEIYSLYVVW